MNNSRHNLFAKALINLLSCLLCVSVLALVLFSVFFAQHATVEIDHPSDETVLDAYDLIIDRSFQNAKSAALSVEKKFWLSEDATCGPVPNASCYGTSDAPSELGWLLDAAAPILDGQPPLFSTETVIMPGSKITYYLDDTIFAVTWKQVMSNFVYTISEVKIADASQFRRHLADDTYDSPNLYPTTTMAQKVNAVVGSSADYYRGRNFGIVVHEGKVMRVSRPDRADVCYIDDKGNLIFSYHGDLTGVEDAQKFVDENNIQFSISFGPIIIDNGERCDPWQYPIGEINDKYARAALCQRDELHYLIVAANAERPYYNNQTIHEFTDNLMILGCKKAYTLDGGNTAAIAVDGELINRTAFGYQRNLSDIIYFCTAIPSTTNSHQE